MPIEIRLPQMSMGMQEGTVVAWLKQLGDHVEEGEELVEVEAEKGTVVVESPGTGVLAEIVVPEGEEAPVLALLGYLAVADEPAGAPPAPAAVAPVGVTTEPEAPGTRLRGLRATIASRMSDSLRTAAQLTLTTEADVSDVWDALGNPAHGGVSFTDVVSLAVVRALAEHPRCNAHLVGDRLIEHPEVHLGLAVALDEGLVVPVLRDAHQLDLGALGRARQDGGRRACAAGGFPADLVTGSTFTITNLGLRGIDAFTPILNAPEVGDPGRRPRRRARRAAGRRPRPGVGSWC